MSLETFCYIIISIRFFLYLAVTYFRNLKSQPILVYHPKNFDVREPGSENLFKKKISKEF